MNSMCNRKLSGENLERESDFQSSRRFSSDSERERDSSSSSRHFLLISSSGSMDRPSSTPTRTSLLIHELQTLWDETGETYTEREKMLLELEQECEAIYNRKLEQTRKYRDELQRALSEAEGQIPSLMSALGENVPKTRKKQGSQTQAQELSSGMDFINKTANKDNNDELEAADWTQFQQDHKPKKKITPEVEEEEAIYNKLEQTRKYRAELQRGLSEAEGQIPSLMSELGENVPKTTRTQAQELSSSSPLSSAPEIHETDLTQNSEAEDEYNNELEANWTQFQQEQQKPKKKITIVLNKKPEVEKEEAHALEEDVCKKTYDRFIPIPVKCIDVEFNKDGAVELALIEWKDVTLPTWVNVDDFLHQYPSFCIWE